MAGFIPKLSSHTTYILSLLRKNAHPWSPQHTKAVQDLKQLTKDLPPLQILSDGKEYCKLMLVMNKEKNLKRFVCG